MGPLILFDGKEGVQHSIHLLAKSSIISPELTNLLIHVSLEVVNASVEPGLTGLDLFLESGFTGLGLQPGHGQEGGYGSPYTGLGPFRKA